MAVLKCKMCGGDLAYVEGATTCECEYCGTVQTVPAADSEKKANLFNRANRLRMNAEYDKAATVYAAIAAEFPEEAEACWGLCLCKYGIEYVDDPATGRKIPTCHRTRPESILDDPDFDQACEYADAVAKRVYREEAKAIDRLQRDILAVVASEAPYDVFICYKETGENGERTEDSVLAQDIHDALTAKGLKVFFARITLEDKLGQQYEPYIYAALHSAKVMLAVGTQFEYFDAPWVKNEWARFLDMMKTDKGKTLIPCYKGIDAYDMPREFKNLQAQDMGKLGWLQDLTRGVMKLCGKDESAKPQSDPEPRATTSGPTVVTLLDRGFMTLEDHEWDKAAKLFDEVLNIDPRNAEAYLGQLMVSGHFSDRKRVGDAYIHGQLGQSASFKRVREFAGEEMLAWLASIDEGKRNYEEELRAAAQRQEDAFENALRFDELYDKYVKGWEHHREETVEKCAKENPEFAQNNEEAERLTLEKEDETAPFKVQGEKLQKKIQELNGQLSALGLFHGKEKKAIKADIDALTAEMETLGRKNKEICRQYDERINTAQCNINMIKRMAADDFDRQNPKMTKEAFARSEDLLDAYNLFRKYQSIKPGYCMNYGRYPTQSDGGLAPIEWVVLEADAKAVILQSKFVIDAQKYNAVDTSVTWKNCTLRGWLNRTFLSTAFNADEMDGLLQVNDDKVTLLSEDEAYKYYRIPSQRTTSATAYAAAKSNGGILTLNGKAGWGLRMEGCYNTYPDVNGIGEITSALHPKKVSMVTIAGGMMSLTCGVRPVIKLNTKAVITQIAHQK